MVNFCTLINIVKHHLHVWFLNCSCSNSSTGVASMGRDNVGAQRVENCPLSPLPRQAAGGGGSQVEQSLLIISFKVLTKHPSVPMNVSSKKQGLNVSKGKKNIINWAVTFNDTCKLYSCQKFWNVRSLVLSYRPSEITLHYVWIILCIMYGGKACLNDFDIKTIWVYDYEVQTADVWCLLATYNTYMSYVDSNGC